MRAYEDVCTNGLVDCRGLASTKVKPFIDAELSDRQSARSNRQNAENAVASRTANLISAGSLFVSFIALVFAGLEFRRKGKSAAAG